MKEEKIIKRERTEMKVPPRKKRKIINLNDIPDTSETSEEEAEHVIIKREKFSKPDRRKEEILKRLENMRPEKCFYDIIPLDCPKERGMNSEEKKNREEVIKNTKPVLYIYESSCPDTPMSPTSDGPYNDNHTKIFPFDIEDVE